MLLYRQGSDIDERSPLQLADFCKSHGLTGIAPKAAEGGAWQATWDSDEAFAIHDTATIEAQRAYYESAGLSYEVWAVPRGTDIDVESAIHSEAGKAAGTLIVDYEQSYPGFFDQGTPDNFLAYSALLRERTPGVRLVLSYDPRQIGREIMNLRALFWHYDAFSAQVYWTDFERPMLEVLPMALTPDTQDRDVCPMLPGNSTPGDLLLACNLAAEALRSPQVYVFQRASFDGINGHVLRTFTR